MRISPGAHFLSFQWFSDGEQVALFPCVGDQNKENNAKLRPMTGQNPECMGENLLPCTHPTKRIEPMLSLSRFRLAIALVMTLAVPLCLFGQNGNPELKSGIIIGTAIDVNGDPVPNAAVELKSSVSGDRRTVTTPESGSFEFRGVQPGVPYEISITA